jgi:hypothetical protein
MDAFCINVFHKGSMKVQSSDVVSIDIDIVLTR